MLHILPIDKLARIHTFHDAWVAFDSHTPLAMICCSQCENLANFLYYRLLAVRSGNFKLIERVNQVFLQFQLHCKYMQFLIVSTFHCTAISLYNLHFLPYTVQCTSYIKKTVNQFTIILLYLEQQLNVIPTARL